MREGGIKEGGTTEATGVLWEHCLGLIRWASQLVPAEASCCCQVGSSRS